MAESTSTTYIPSRSISLPTRLIHPKSEIFEEKMKKLQASSSISPNLNLGLPQLIELYEFINEQVIDSPEGQQALSPHIENALDDSITLLDACEFTRDLIATFMEQIQDLQSTLRRRRGDISSIESNIQNYATIQKNLQSRSAKQLKSLKRSKTRTDKKLRFGSDMVQQANIATFSMFQSLLLFLSSSNQTKNMCCGSGQSLIGSMHRKLTRRKNGSVVMDAEVMMKRLGVFSMSLGAVDEELVCLSRSLIQHRMSLLNIITL